MLIGYIRVSTGDHTMDRHALRCWWLVSIQRTCMRIRRAARKMNGLALLHALKGAPQGRCPVNLETGSHRPKLKASCEHAG